MARKPETGFLNVDLEVGARTRTQLQPLVDELGGTLFELWRGRIGSLYRAHYEISGCGLGANRTIHELADRIEALRPSARRAWDAASMRDFNIGVELERGVRNIELAIDADVIRRVAALGGRIAVTAYQVAAMKRATLSAARSRRRGARTSSARDRSAARR